MLEILIAIILKYSVEFRYFSSGGIFVSPKTGRGIKIFDHCKHEISNLPGVEEISLIWRGSPRDYNLYLAATNVKILSCQWKQDYVQNVHVLNASISESERKKKL